jgi:hypothetical protein
MHASISRAVVHTCWVQCHAARGEEGRKERRGGEEGERNLMEQTLISLSSPYLNARPIYAFRLDAVDTVHI